MGSIRYYGYLENNKRAEKELTKDANYNQQQLNGFTIDKDLSQGDFIEVLIENGYEPIKETLENSPKIGKPCKSYTVYYMKDEKGNSKYDITKTLYEFAVFLKNKNFNSEEYDKKANDEENITLHENMTEEEFEKWLVTQAKFYSNHVLEELLEKIFKTEYGTYDSYAKSLLVLIDNIDNNICKNKLITKLYGGNIANRRTFECVTGLTLPKTDKDIKLYLQTRTKDDFKEMKEYNPIDFKVKNNSSDSNEKIFQIKDKTGFIDVKGYPYNEYELEMFFRYSEDKVIISEVKTGIKLSEGTNENEAKLNLKNKIDSKGIDKLKEMLSKQEINPLYNIE